MKVPDLFVGRRLFVGCGEPVGLGIGPTEIRGSAYIEGPMIVGNPLTYPVAEANLMVARCVNVEALTPPPLSIFKVSSRTLPPTPLDVMLGDPTGPVGIQVNSTIISILNQTVLNIVSPITNGTGILNWIGAKTLTGAEVLAGAKAQAGAEARAGGKTLNGVTVINGSLLVTGAITSNVDVIARSNILSDKKSRPFDMKHPTKEGWRLRHVCLEGPEIGVYKHGKCSGKIIDMPDYWSGLVREETISVQLTPVGTPRQLSVEKIENNKVYIGGDDPGEYFYLLHASRYDDDLIVEYEGNSHQDYPGGNQGYEFSFENDNMERIVKEVIREKLSQMENKNGNT
jgi:hypothetical protein